MKFYLNPRQNRVSLSLSFKEGMSVVLFFNLFTDY